MITYMSTYDDIANGLTAGGSALGGAVGHGMETVGFGMEAGESAVQHNWGNAIKDGADALQNGVEAVADGEHGNWL